MSRGKLSVSRAKSSQGKKTTSSTEVQVSIMEFDGCSFYMSVQIPFDFTNNTPWNKILTDASCYVHVGIQGHILVKTPDNPSLFPRARQTQVLRCFSDGGHWRPHAQPAQHVGMTDAQICLLHVSLWADEGVVINHHTHTWRGSLAVWDMCLDDARWLFHFFDYLCL